MKNLKNKVFSVLIPDGESWLSYSVQNCLAHVPGVKLTTLSNNFFDPIRFSRHTHKFIAYPKALGSETQLQAIHDAVKNTRIDIILPVDTPTIRLISEYKQSLEKLVAVAPIPDVSAIDMASNKWLLAKWLKKHNVPCPETLLYRADTSFEQELRKLVFPVLLKPTEQVGDLGIGGRGIHVFDNPSALLQFCAKNETIEYIVQSFINGYDIDCSVLCQEGKIIAHTTQKGFIAAHGRFEPPAGIELINDTSTYTVVEDLVEKMNWSGVAHFDLRYDENDNQVKVIEINARFWGSLFGSFYAGVNFPYLTCLAGLGLDIPETTFTPSRYVNGGAAIKLLYQRFIRRNSENTQFDNSALDFMLKDPLPKGVSTCAKAYSKIISSFSCSHTPVMPGTKNKI